MHVVENIEELCGKFNISIYQLESKLGYGRGSIRTWNNRKVSMEKVFQVADFFGVSIEWMCGRSSQPPSPNDLEVQFLYKSFENMSKEAKKDVIEILKIFLKYFSN